VLSLQPSALDYSSDGIMVNPTAGQFGQGVYHYVRALALASAAAHTTGEAQGHMYSQGIIRGRQPQAPMG
jgi:hypothetical protein